MDIQHGVLFSQLLLSESRQSEKEQVVPADGAGSDTAICLRRAGKWETWLGLYEAECLYTVVIRFKPKPYSNLGSWRAAWHQIIINLHHWHTKQSTDANIIQTSYAIYCTSKPCLQSRQPSACQRVCFPLDTLSDCFLRRLYLSLISAVTSSSHTDSPGRVYSSYKKKLYFLQMRAGRGI